MSAFTITGPGFYKMRSGRKAWVAGRDPFRGKWIGSSAEDENACISAHSWFEAGNTWSEVAHPYDIVAPWRDPVRVEGWVNVYPSWRSDMYDSRRDADEGQGAIDRIACVRVTGEEEAA